MKFAFPQFHDYLLNISIITLDFKILFAKIVTNLLRKSKTFQIFFQTLTLMNVNSGSELSKISFLIYKRIFHFSKKILSKIFENSLCVSLKFSNKIFISFCSDFLAEFQENILRYLKHLSLQFIILSLPYAIFRYPDLILRSVYNSTYRKLGIQTFYLHSLVHS